MYKLLTLNKIAQIGLGELDTSKFTHGDALENPDGVILRSASMHDMDFGDNLLAIARAGAGVNNIPIEKCSSSGIVVFNTPGANANAVKELAIAALFMSSRNITGGVEWAKTLVDAGDDVPKLVEKGKSEFTGPEIKGKTIGVVGLGAIGVMVANAAYHLGMKVIGFDPFISVDAAWGLSRFVSKAVSIDDICAQSDYITLHLPLNDNTKAMINDDVISKLKTGVRILNFSRGELVDNSAITAALEQGKIAAYVTDFPNKELIGKKGVIPIPHLGASTPESEDNCAVMACREISDYLLNGNISNSVNLPNVNLARNGVMRICVIHKNIPNMLSNISSCCGAKNVNIENMLNKSKKEYAYTVIDACSIDESIAKEIEAIEGVIRARIII